MHQDEERREGARQRPRDNENLARRGHFFPREDHPQADSHRADEANEHVDEYPREGDKQTLIGSATFLSKSGQRVKFSSRLTYIVEATKTVWRAPPAGLVPFGESGGSTTGTSSATAYASPGLLGVSGAGSTGLSGGPSFASGILGTSGPSLFVPSSGFTVGGTSGSPSPLLAEESRREGRHIFEVQWSATLTANGKLTRPKIESVDHKSTTWEEPA